MEIKIIEKLPVERWEEFKNLRIEAHKTDPNSFSGGLEETMNQSEQDYRSKLERNLKGESIWVFADYGGKLVGVGYAHIYTNPRFRHNASLQALFVSPEYRKKGVGEMLINKRLEILSRNPEIINVICEVYGTQVASVELHKKLGFEISGLIKDFVCIDGQYFDLFQFLKRIK
jgi:ribosomal protein S18 acetylase RimI-like enzyme